MLVAAQRFGPPGYPTSTRGNPMKSLPILAAAAALALAGAAQADPRQNPTADYMAEAVAKTQGQPDSTSKIWYTKDKVRVDVNHQGQTMAVIMDRPAKKMFVMIPMAPRSHLAATGARNPTVAMVSPRRKPTARIFCLRVMEVTLSLLVSMLMTILLLYSHSLLWG